MKNLIATVIDFLKSYTSLFILPILLFVFLRIGEYTLLIENLESLYDPFRSFTYSVEFDLIFLALYYLVFFIFFFILFIISKRLYHILFFTFLVILSFIYLALNQFFYTSDLLIDKTIFFFSWEEMKIILGGESNSVFGQFFWIYFLALIILILEIWYVFPKLKSNKILRITAQLLTLVCLVLFIARGEIHPKSLDKYNNYETQLHTSKVTYFFSSLGSLFFKENFDTDDKLINIKSYRKLIDGNGYLQKLEYPFMHSIDDLNKNDWSNYISEHEKIQNVVFVIAEGLSSRFSGENAKYGSMTPFLDSLIQQSLYWPNMLSITDRTHGIFAAALAGLPHGFERGFLNYEGDAPKYISIPDILKKKGYSLNFLYGGWSHFDNYHSFLKKNKFDSIINEEYIKNHFNYKLSNSDNQFSWGYHDHATVDAYFQFMEKHTPSSPYFNIYLTLSLHSPYDIPDKAFYVEQAKKELTALKPDFFEENKEVISTVYYADQSLERFFKRYKERADFNETLFIILGDHSVKALDLSSDLGIYHVPFILYSPNINKPQKFNEVISHWDVPATLIDILPNVKWSEKTAFTHWLGNGVSFSNELSAKQPIFLSTFRGDIIGLVWKNTAYIHGRLYQLKKGMELQPYKNNEVEISMKKLLELYIWLNRYTIENNRITS